MNVSIEMIEVLVDKNVINQSSIISGMTKSKAMSTSQTFKVERDIHLLRIVQNDNSLQFVGNDVWSIDDKFSINLEDVTKIDGMSFDSISKLYQVKFDGKIRITKLCPITGLPAPKGRQTNKYKKALAAKLLENSSSE